METTNGKFVPFLSPVLAANEGSDGAAHLHLSVEVGCTLRLHVCTLYVHRLDVMRCEMRVYSVVDDGNQPAKCVRLPPPRTYIV